MNGLRILPTPIHVKKRNFRNKMLQWPNHGFSGPGPKSAQEQAVGEHCTSHERNCENKEVSQLLAVHSWVEILLLFFGL